MKTGLLCFCLGALITAVNAQSKRTGTQQPLVLYSNPNPQIIDTSSIKDLTENFAIGRAHLDNMPVLLPKAHNSDRIVTGKGLKSQDPGIFAWPKGPLLQNKKQRPLKLQHPLYVESTYLYQKKKRS